MTQPPDPRFPPPSPTYPPYVPQAPANGMGTAGFVLGLIGLIFSFIPVFGVVAWPLVLLGIVFSGVGLYRANTGAATNQGMAIAGLACSSVGLFICLVYLIVFTF